MYFFIREMILKVLTLIFNSFFFWFIKINAFEFYFAVKPFKIERRSKVLQWSTCAYSQLFALYPVLLMVFSGVTLY